MPIPTRSLSLRKKAETSIPARKTPDAQVSGNSTDGDAAVATRTRSAVTKSDDQVRKPTGIRPRGTLLPLAQVRPSAGHVMTPSTTTVAATPKPVSTRTPHVQATAPVTRQVSQIRPPGTIPSSAKGRVANAHTRSVSSTTAEVGRGTGTRLVRPSATVGSTRHPIPRAAGSINPDDEPRSTLATSRTVAFENLRDDLCQLKFLHLASTHSLTAFTKSLQADQDLKRSSLISRQENLLKVERTSNRATNSAALHAWLSADACQKDERQLQTLSSAILDLEKFDLDLYHDEMRPLRVFQDWLTESLAHREDRRSRSLQHKGMSTIVPLGSSWLHAMADLQRSVTVTMTTLEQFSHAPQGSALADIIQQHITFAKVCIQEIDTAVRLEALLVQDENDWEARELVQALDRLTHNHQKAKTRTTGVWMTV